jgi:hypothetical protein
MQQTVSENFNINLLDTLRISCILFIFTSKVKNLLNMKNSQVTKAFNNDKFCYINYNFFNSFVKRHKMKCLNIQLFKNNRYGILGQAKHTKFSNLSDSKLELNTLNPYYVTGFTDGEGCFLINIKPFSKLKTGYSVELVFKIALHLKDKPLLEKIQTFFGVGIITVRTDGYIQYRVGSIKDLELIINHFDNYPLISHKWSDFKLFKKAAELIKRKDHLTNEGLKKIVSIKSVLNNGLSDDLKIAFPFLDREIRPTLKTNINFDPNWISGQAKQVDGEGCFYISVTKTPIKTKIGFSVRLKFYITQHSRDKDLLTNLAKFLGCGNYYIRSKSSDKLIGDYVTTGFKDITEKIIPFFEKYPLKGCKDLDFSSFKRVAELMKSKAHLKESGLKEILLIKSKMNKGRLFLSNNKSSLSSFRRSAFKLDNPFQTKRKYSTGQAKQVDCESSFINTDDQLELINKNHKQEISFYEWLAGLIDGKGELRLTKKGFASFKIVMNVSDKKAIYEIKHKYGGTVKTIAGSNSLKYKLDHKKGIINLISDINGQIRNPIRLLQLNKLCEFYNIQLKETKPLSYHNGWFSGFIDSDGSIYIDENSGLLTISVTQKNKYLLEPLMFKYSGKIKILKSKEAFQYTVFKKTEILNLVDNYFKFYPLKSGKAHKIDLIKRFYILIPSPNILKLNVSSLKNSNINIFRQWIEFKNKWDKL